MDDNKLKSLFEDYQPEISSDFIFMNNLQRNMDAMEMVRQHNIAMQRQNRRAVVMAAFVGFISGIIITLLFPYILQSLAGLGQCIRGISDHIISQSATIGAFTVSTAVEMAIVIYTYNHISGLKQNSAKEHVS